MEEKASRSHLKRSFFEDEDPDKPPMQKRARFPKGKKVKAGEQALSARGVEESTSELPDPNYAAKERANRRGQMTTELFIEENKGMIGEISSAEINYEENTNFVEDGIQIEPFNLDQEREEGYFDAEGNFVEYANDREIKDAWLDSVEVDSRFAEKYSGVTKVEEVQDLSSEDIGKIKRRIANLLEPRETVLQALRRLKGTSNDRKERMPEETKRMFDQLTEDAMKLLENGDYNVYHDRQDVFEREAEGYERLARARDGTSTSVVNGSGAVPSSTAVHGNGKDSSSTEVIGSGAADTFDMFAEDDEKPTSNPSSDGHGLGSATDSELSQPTSENLNINSEGGALQSDYVFDESSGYYYSSSLGYYYDPTSGLYCCASSGRWYSYNEQTSTYEEVPEVHEEVQEAAQSVAQG